ncbi:MAG: hypothetical protein ACI89X_001148 [Planctomycetota bacterium]|jgi:hypothetical protein
MWGRSATSHAKHHAPVLLASDRHAQLPIEILATDEVSKFVPMKNTKLRLSALQRNKAATGRDPRP